MKHFVSPRGLRAAIVAVFGATLISATPQPSSVASSYAAAETTVDVGITPRDVAASNQKVRMAHSALVSMWDTGFRRLGQRFYADHPPQRPHAEVRIEVFILEVLARPVVAPRSERIDDRTKLPAGEGQAIVMPVRVGLDLLDDSAESQRFQPLR